MTLSEFKAWFEGYTEGLETAPTKAQFDRIKEKVKEISGQPVTQTVFYDRYWNHPHYPNGYPYYGTISSGGVGIATNSLNAGNATASAQSQKKSFDSHAAMYSLGKAEAAN